MYNSYGEEMRESGLGIDTSSLADSKLPSRVILSFALIKSQGSSGPNQ